MNIHLIGYKNGGDGSSQWCPLWFRQQWWHEESTKVVIKSNVSARYVQSDGERYET